MDTQKLLLVTGVLCVPGLMSTCACSGSHEDQKVCGQYEKATHEHRCMYEVFDRFCDNTDAQYTARGFEPVMKPKKKLRLKFRDPDERQRRDVERNRSVQRKRIRERRRDV